LHFDSHVYLLSETKAFSDQIHLHIRQSKDNSFFLSGQERCKIGKHLANLLVSPSFACLSTFFVSWYYQTGVLPVGIIANHKNKVMIRSIQNRIILLIAFIGIGMFAGIIFSRQVESLRIKSMLDKEKSESSISLNRVIEFVSKSLKDFAYDYTFWDEMVNFTKTGDPVWAQDNITVSLPTFNLQHAWVYKTDFSLLYSANPAKSDEMNTLPLPVDQLKKLVQTGYLYHFYIKIKAGLMEVSGGSIHPVSDPDRLTEPQGYFFVGRIWTDHYIGEIEAFTGTKVSFLNQEIALLPSDSIIPKEYSYVNYKALNGWGGELQSILMSTGTMGIAKDFESRSNHILILLAVILIISLIGVSLVLIRVINRPLRYLISSLVTDDPGPISGLLKEQSEFGYLAKLMSDSFIQKKNLEAEIAGRIKVEQELTLAKNRAEESDRLKTAFLNNISHEIRTPMNAIIGFSELITDSRISEQERIEFTGIIHDSSYRLLGIISDLISISTIESGQIAIAEERTHLNGLLHDIFTQTKKEIGIKPIDLLLDVALQDDHSMILSDHEKLKQILLNLLNNAVKFSHSGKILFGYTIRNAELEFFVKDNGIGIPPEKFETIFARFQQADDSMSRHYGGNGLGLPISKAYVELLGGRIWLKSEIGKGTQFYFSIPFKPV
jgi:signal transduction histidine kinase